MGPSVGYSLASPAIKNLNCLLDLWADFKTKDLISGSGF